MNGLVGRWVEKKKGGWVGRWARGRMSGREGGRVDEWKVGGWETGRVGEVCS